MGTGAATCRDLETAGVETTHAVGMRRPPAFSGAAFGTIRRVVPLSVGAGLVGMALLLAGARWCMTSTLAGPVQDGAWTARSRAWFTATGLFAAEFDARARRSFTWTRQSARFVLPHLDRSQPHRLTFQVRTGRPRDSGPLPLVHVAVDGVVATTVAISDIDGPATVLIPTQRRREGATVTLAVSSTFAPGGDDPRSLGIVIDGIDLQPASGHFRPSGRVLLGGGFAIMAAVAGVLLCGLRFRAAAAVSAALTAGVAWLLLRDAAFVGEYVDRLIRIGWGVAGTGAVVALVRWRRPASAGRADWSIAIAIALAATTLKLALFAHPVAVVGDGIFQVHRAMLVHDGRYFFTSVTPKPFFEFPYPIGLYVAAQPFWRFFPSLIDRLWLLRAICLVADAAVGLALFAAVRRQWRDGRAALFCAALWPFAPAPMQALGNGNLTNAFGQSLFGVAVGVIAWSAAGTRSAVPALAAAGLSLTAAFLSHVSTVSAGVPILVASSAMMVLLAGPPRVRRCGGWVLAVVASAAVLSYVVYYSHFGAVYHTTLGRLVSQDGEIPGSKLVAAPSMKLQRWLRGTSDDYGLPGLPLLLAAGAGLAVSLARRWNDSITRALFAWVVVWAGLTAVEMLSPMEMRLNLAAAPAFVCLGACALAALATRRRLGLMLASAAAVAIAADGLRIWLWCVDLIRR